MTSVTKADLENYNATDEQTEMVNNILQLKIIGKHILHTLFAEDDAEEVIWNGKIMDQKRTKSIVKYRVSYWQMFESADDDAVDHRVIPAALAVDYLNGDLFFK